MISPRDKTMPSLSQSLDPSTHQDTRFCDLGAHDRRHRSSKATQAGPLGDDAQIAKSGELPPEALMRCRCNPQSLPDES